MTEEQKAQRTWLFHQTLGSKIFTITPAEQEELEADGWVDTPAKLKPVEPKQEQKPDQTPADLTKEAERLLAVFVVEPTKLTKDELIALGKEFQIEKLTRNMSEATLIGKIQEYLDGDGK